MEICQDYGDELINGPAGSFPGVSITDTFVSQIGTEPLEMRETILGYSSSPAMSAMLKRVRKHRKAFSDAQSQIQNYHTTLQARRNQDENAVR